MVSPSMKKIMSVTLARLYWRWAGCPVRKVHGGNPVALDDPGALLIELAEPGKRFGAEGGGAETPPEPGV